MVNVDQIQVLEISAADALTGHIAGCSVCMAQDVSCPGYRKLRTRWRYMNRARQCIEKGTLPAFRDWVLNAYKEYAIEWNITEPIPAFLC